MLYVEKVNLDKFGNFFASELVKATDDDIKEFKSKPCNHSITVDKLVYDKEGIIYDERYCGVCDSLIDFI